MKYFITTFGCAQNEADSQRIAAAFSARGYTKASSIKTADTVVINTCMVRESAENRAFGLVNNLSRLKIDPPVGGRKLKIILTGCMVGVALRDKTGKYLKHLRDKLPAVDEFMPIEEVGFDTPPVRATSKMALVPISNGCNNFCTFCIVPFTRGREVSRPFEDIIAECKEIRKKGYKEVMLLGQNVNSYGADLVVGAENIQVMRDLPKTYFDQPVIARTSGTKQSPSSVIPDKRSEVPGSVTPVSNKNFELQTITFGNKKLQPIFVKHLGRYRLPTLFPYLLEEVAKLGFKKVDFISSNPWDFSDELIEVIARNNNITRTLHIAVQSGSNSMLKRMNRWYTREDFITLINKIRTRLSLRGPKGRGNLTRQIVNFTTDIIVGFPGETEEEYKDTVSLCKEVGFQRAFISRYSSRPFTAATKVMKDNISPVVKKRRWQKLDRLVNAFAY